MEEKLKTIKRWRDDAANEAEDKSKGVGVTPSMEKARVEADSFNRVLRLFDPGVRNEM